MAGGSSRRYPPELRERAVRMVAEISGQHESEWAAMSEVARLLGVGCAETVRKWVRQAQVDAGSRPGRDHRGVRGAEAAEAGERRIAKGQRDPEDSVGFLRGRTRPATALIVRFIAEHQGHRDGPDGLRWGVESICDAADRAGCADRPIDLLRPRRSQAQPRARCVTRTSNPRSRESTPPTTASTGPARCGWH